MKAIVILFFTVLSVTVSKAELSTNKKISREISHISNMTQRPDGLFDVTCIDGSTEVKSADDIYNNDVCLFQSTEIFWILETGGTIGSLRLCDVVTNRLEKDGKFISFSAHFNKPCVETISTQASCVTSDTCDVVMDGQLYNFYFRNDYEMVLTRASDSLIGNYEAN
ncbi:MAG: hypothetical protein K2P92_06805 [Bdellovibrionaceae bacterium]|nr:hypothetical protein [Pseudobdellovibrionaceae bacterium]